MNFCSYHLTKIAYSLISNYLFKKIETIVQFQIALIVILVSFMYFTFENRSENGTWT